MAPSRHDWKIVDWDLKPQHNQPTWPADPTPPKRVRLVFYQKIRQATEERQRYFMPETAYPTPNHQTATTKSIPFQHAANRITLV